MGRKREGGREERNENQGQNKGRKERRAGKERREGRGRTVKAINKKGKYSCGSCTGIDIPAKTRAE